MALGRPKDEDDRVLPKQVRVKAIQESEKGVEDLVNPGLALRIVQEFDAKRVDKTEEARKPHD